MARTTSKGFKVWDLEVDPFNHTELAANWDLLNSLLDQPAKAVQVVSALPGSPTAGDLAMTSTTVNSFRPYSLIRYDGSVWRAVAGVEIMPALPTTENFDGRVVLLSSANGGFGAWDLVRHQSGSWHLIGGLSKVDTGNGATNIQGLQTSGDLYINDSARGFVLVDRSSGQKKRLYFNNNQLYFETVT